MSDKPLRIPTQPVLFCIQCGYGDHMTAMCSNILLMPAAAASPPPCEDVNLDALRSEYMYGVIEGLLRNALDVRGRLLCCLSAEDGEWSYSGVKKYAKEYHRFMKRANSLADDYFSKSQKDDIIFAMMAELAAQMEQPTILPWS